MPAYDSLYERLIANSAEPENDRACWVWTGNCRSKGYGQLTMRLPGIENPRGVLAHREMFKLLFVPELELDLVDGDPFSPIVHLPGEELGYDDTVEHLCGNTSCINPDHFTWMSRVDNRLAAIARQRVKKFFG